MAKKTITLSTDGRWVQKEAAAAVAITPGELIARNSAGKFIPHGSSGGSVMPMFAVENDLAGEGIDTDYAISDQVRGRVFSPGGEVFAFLTAGESVAIGATLESDGIGGLQAETSGIVIAIALEAVDRSASGVARGRIKIETV